MKPKVYFILLILIGYYSYGQECTKVNFPSEGSSNVAVDVEMTWPEVSGINGYLISLGTTPGGTELLRRESTGIVNSYQAPVGLPENTLIYVTISVLLFNATPMKCETTSFTTMNVTTPPPCTYLFAPDDNAANVTIVTDIIWRYAHTATRYYLSIGTSEGGTDILNNLNVGNVLSYDPPSDLPQNVRIYVTIRPENDIGSATDCQEESFFTGPVDDPCEEINQDTGEVTSLGPDIELPTLFIKCKDRGPITVSADGKADHFSWYNIVDGKEILLSENRIFQITETGNYVLEAHNRVNRSGITIECYTTKNFNVISSEIAIIESIDVRKLAFGKQVEINVSGSGDYEFALDDENGPYQDDPIFVDVADGSHVVFVRDKNGCGSVSQLIERDLRLDDFPNFFTPNGDGINDYWQFIRPPEITDILEIVKGRISIFDRYGSLVLELDPDSNGWDGNFNGKPLPPSDYWFKAVSIDLKEVNGHFSLKR